MREQAIGLDIGGANLKLATSSGIALSRPFELWRHPHKLAAELNNFAEQFSGCGPVAITMTGELCDCFLTKRDGVRFILAALASVFAQQRICVWSTAGVFLSLNEALDAPLTVASANWHAQATFVGAFFCSSGFPANRLVCVPDENLSYESRSALLIDTGSTTTDVIPIHKSRPVPLGLSDSDRLKSRELIYTGVRRTPICALFGSGVAAEFFATTQDAYLLLGKIGDNPNDKATADGRAATKPFAHARLARMLGGDSQFTLAEETLTLARNTFEVQVAMIRGAMQEVSSRLSAIPSLIVVSGSGEFLARAAAEEYAAAMESPPSIYSLSEKLGPGISEAACAYSLARLAVEKIS